MKRRFRDVLDAFLGWLFKRLTDAIYGKPKDNDPRNDGEPGS